MQCDKAITSYMLMVQFDVVPHEGDNTMTVWTPCFRDLGMEGNEMAQEVMSFLSRDDALAEMDRWQKRFPNAEYKVEMVISR